MRPPRDPAFPVPIHRLRPNDKVWTPPSVVFLDTETKWVEDGPDELHTMRTWVACHVDRRGPKSLKDPVTWGWGQTPASTAEWINSRMVGRDCLWLYAHNLNFDLVTTNLAENMMAHGWQINDFSVTHGAPWMRLGRKGRTITVCDSWSWLPTRLESLATLMGRHKVDLPDNAADDTEWIRRCAVDIDLLARAVLDLMAWWDREKLGRWSISGAGSGWNAMRHTASPERHIIDVTPEDVALDRAANHGGRKDSAVVRSSEGGPWVDLDFSAAYPTIARELPLPVKRANTFAGLPTDSKWIGSRFYGIVARCLIDTDKPRYPVRHAGVTWYPTGRFWTTLAGPEIEWARDSGHLVTIGAGQLHRLGLALRPWATWVLDPTYGGTVEVPAVAHTACKAWGRAVIGKFAARSSTMTELEGAAPPGWGCRDMWDRTADRPGAEVRMGGRAYLVTFDTDTENCYPAVAAFVASHVRVRLGKVLEALSGAWWTADTDGMLVDMSIPVQWTRWGAVRLGDLPRDPIGLAERLCRELEHVTTPLKLRPKRSYDSLEVIGPQHLVTGGERRLSGVSAAAVEIERHRYVGRDWPKLKWQLANSTPGTYRRPERTSTFTGPTVHRWVTADGTTVAPRFRVDEQGANVLVPWADTPFEDDRPELAPVQYRKLEALT